MARNQSNADESQKEYQPLDAENEPDHWITRGHRRRDKETGKVALLLTIPGRTADEWEEANSAFADDETIQTVAEKNPEYPSNDRVFEIAYIEDFPEWWVHGDGEYTLAHLYRHGKGDGLLPEVDVPIHSVPESRLSPPEWRIEE